VQGRMCASPPRFEPRPWLPGCCAERARRGRACTCTAAATHRHALDWDAGLAWVHGGTAAARSAWTFHVLVLAVAVRLPRRPVGVVRVGAGDVDAAAVTPRAASLITRELHRVGVRGKCTPACRQATHPSVEPQPSRVPSAPRAAAPMCRAPMPSASALASMRCSGRRGRHAGRSHAAW
jgi:hypothetical protein